jgi:hypothetical protein
MIQIDLKLIDLFAGIGGERGILPCIIKWKNVYLPLKMLLKNATKIIKK